MAGVWVRRSVAAACGVASFGACYGGLTVAYPKMDSAVALGWSALPLTVVLGVLLGWAERPRSAEGSESPRSDEGNEGRLTVRVTRSPHAQAVGTAEGLNIGPGAVFNSPVFHVGATARPIAPPRNEPWPSRRRSMAPTTPKSLEPSATSATFRRS